MNVNIDINAAARRIQALVKASGGTVKYSRALEEAAQMCGFDNYRAAEAARKAEQAEPLKIRRTIRDWAHADNACVSEKWRADVSPRQTRQFEFELEQSGSQFSVRMYPTGSNQDKLDGTDFLDLFIEINDGLPCVHLTNDPYDNMLCSVFSTREGLFIRKDGGDWKASALAEGFLSDVVKENENNDRDRHNRGYIVEHDTAAKYAS